jgi:hypothetical protein
MPGSSGTFDWRWTGMFEIRITFTRTHENDALYPSNDEDEARVQFTNQRDNLLESEDGWKLVVEHEGLCAVFYSAQRTEWALVTHTEV